MYFLGDIHSQFHELISVLSKSGIKGETIFQVGDFGVGIKDPIKEMQELNELNNFCFQNDLRLKVIRGNHDDPARFTGTSEFSNIFFAKDYSVFHVEEQTILTVGGGISVDRSLRTQLPFWPNEGFQYDEIALRNCLNEINKVDIVVTHSSPAEFWPYQFELIVLKYLDRDSLLMYDLNKERQDHSKLLKTLISNKLLPRKWFFGHFHSSKTAAYNSIDYHLLDVLELVRVD